MNHAIGRTKRHESIGTRAAWTRAITFFREARLRLPNSLGKSASAISDQGFFALGNFAVNTILARQMSQVAFGRFSAAFAGFLLLSTVYCAFVVDPMLIYGGSAASGLQQSYVRRVVVLHWRAALALSAALLGIGLIRLPSDAGRESLPAYIGWAIAAPAVLRLWLARRSAYLVMKPHLAAIAGCFYLLIIGALLFAFGDLIATNVVAACLIVAVSSFSVAFFLHRSLPLVDSAPASVSADRVIRAHWRFGKWASIAGILALFPDYVYFFVLSPARCGQYRALLNVVLPLTQIYNALGVLMMSYFARHRGRPDFFRIARRAAFAFCGLALTLSVLAACLGPSIFGYLYGGKYELSLSRLWPLVVVSFLFAMKAVSDALLRVLERVTAMAAVAVAGVIAALTIGLPLALRFGTPGAVYGDLISYGAASLALAVVWLKLLRTLRKQGASNESSEAGNIPVTHPEESVPQLQSYIEF